MKILVTGGAGFIGSHIVDALIQKGEQVIVIDNLYRGLEKNIHPEAKFYRLSINDPELRNIFKKEQPQVVIHEAAQTVVTRSVAEPVFDAESNILGSLNILSCCVTFNVSKIIYASSCAAYGKPEYLPVDEKHPANSVNPYGISKHTVEHYLQLYHDLYELNYLAFRYANVYGPRQDPRGEGGVVAIFSDKMLKGKQPVIFGSGDKGRDYVFVEDIVRANILAINSPKVGIYNLGSGKETSDQAIFNAISRECCYTGLPSYDSERPGEIKRIYLDSSIANQDLGWNPLISLQVGISKTVEYYRNI
jgi:UDP-glucose 4-epimerase